MYIFCIYFLYTTYTLMSINITVPNIHLNTEVYHNLPIQLHDKY